MRILADSHIPFVKEYFGAYGELTLKPGRFINNEDVQNTDILLVRSITHVDEQLLKNSAVKFVGSVTAGADHLDTQCASCRRLRYQLDCRFAAQKSVTE